MVGDCDRDQRRLKFLRKCSDTQGWLISQWTLEFLPFLHKIAHSLDREFYTLPWETMKLECLVLSLRENNSLPARPLTCSEAARLRIFKQENQRFKREINVIRHAESESRNKPKARRSSQKGLN